MPAVSLSLLASVKSVLSAPCDRRVDWLPRKITIRYETIRMISKSAIYRKKIRSIDPSRGSREQMVSWTVMFNANIVLRVADEHGTAQYCSET